MRRARRWPLFVILLLAIATGHSCQRAVRSLGDSRVEARRHAEALFGALAARFGPVLLDPRLEGVRAELARSALVPSRLLQASKNEPRLFEFMGTRTPGGYRLTLGQGVAAPQRPADYRGVLRLRALRQGEYEWTLREELAVGSVGAGPLAEALTQIFPAAGDLRPEEAPAAARASLPRTAAALGRLFRLETLRLEPAEGGAVAVTLEARLEPERLARQFPHYARYLTKYVSPARTRVILLDGTGATWWVAEARDNRFRLQLRVLRGNLAPWQGAPRALPDRLRVVTDVSAKMGLFRVGVRRLEGDVVLVRTPSRKAFIASFTHAPEWDLPFLIEPFLRSSLRRPFEGEGAQLGFGIESNSAGVTLLTRDYRIAVKESRIVRWLGGLGGDALSEFRRGAEAEANRFVGEALSALRQDVLALMESG
jgi:hypothetical protein